MRFISSRTWESGHLNEEERVMWGKELWAPFQPTLYFDFCQNKLSCCCRSPTWINQGNKCFWFFLCKSNLSFTHRTQVEYEVTSRIIINGWIIDMREKPVWCELNIPVTSCCQSLTILHWSSIINQTNTHLLCPGLRKSHLSECVQRREVLSVDLGWSWILSWGKRGSHPETIFLSLSAVCSDECL